MFVNQKSVVCRYFKIELGTYTIQINTIQC